MIKDLKKTIYIFPIFILAGLGFLIFGNNAYGATNISSNATEHWAWNDIVGWMDFWGTMSVNVSPTQLTGYAGSSVGDISLDCATASSGNICAPANDNYKVINDGNGNLSGWGWNDNYGWVSFCGGGGADPNCPGSIAYYVSIDPNTGVFSGYAWNDIIGWISFNCADINPPTGVCGTSNFKVKTSWVATSTSAIIESATFDTGVGGGAQINSFYFEGELPNGSSANFQFAVSNSTSGPWTYFGPSGTGSYYTPNHQGFPRTKVDFVLHNNMRYFRYKILLMSDQAQRNSPVIEKVVVDWSP